MPQYFGRKRFLIACIVIFMASSFACGIAPSLGLLIVARVIQGVGGGALQPISQAILLESFPPEKRGMAMAAFGLGVVVAPIIGPTLGGWLTDNYSWRWAFYINIPVGVGGHPHDAGVRGGSAVHPATRSPGRSTPSGSD